MRHRREEDYLSGNLTAMIDVVFQLIIFFVCTISIQDSVVDERIRMAMAPHGKAVEKKDPREINISIDGDGIAYIARTPLSDTVLLSVLKKAVADFGQQVPVIIRGDADTKHADVKRVMDACAKSGIWKIKFAAFKERA
jgi:biopolymer transport protein ExbD